MQTIYEQKKDALIATLPRTVNYYDSGLIQVSQTFVGKTSNANAFRSNLEVGDSFPTYADIRSVDGIRIFPAVSENVRKDGLSDFLVTGYGRSNMQGITRFEYGATTFSLTLPEVVVEQEDGPDIIVQAETTKIGIYRTKTQIIKRVMRINEVYDFNSDITKPYTAGGVVIGIFTPQFITGYPTLTGVWEPAVVSFQSQAYGEFQEVTVAISGVQISV